MFVCKSDLTKMSKVYGNDNDDEASDSNADEYENNADEYDNICRRVWQYLPTSMTIFADEYDSDDTEQLPRSHLLEQQDQWPGSPYIVLHC